MKTILAIGDFHIPRRARAVPDAFGEIMHGGDFDAVLCTGDLVSSTMLAEVEAIADVVLAVAGNMDELDLPTRDASEFLGWRIALFHGTEVFPRGDRGQIASWARRLQADLLVTGHTHAHEVYPTDLSDHRAVVVNPGSATGVQGGGGGTGIPSLAVLELTREQVKITFHLLRRDEMETETHVLPHPRLGD